MGPLDTHALDLDERKLAGKLAGALFLTAGLSALILLFLPGIEALHRSWVIGLGVGCVAWALFCLTVARPAQHGLWFWHLPAVSANSPPLAAA